MGGGGINVNYRILPVSKDKPVVLSHPECVHEGELELLVAAQVPGREAVAVHRRVPALGWVQRQ